MGGGGGVGKRGGDGVRDGVGMMQRGRGVEEVNKGYVRNMEEQRCRGGERGRRNRES